MKKVILTTLLIFIALAGAVVPAFAESCSYTNNISINVPNSTWYYNFASINYSNRLDLEYDNYQYSNSGTSIDPNYPIIYTVTSEYYSSWASIPNYYLYSVLDEPTFLILKNSGGTANEFSVLGYLDDFLNRITGSSANISSGQKQLLQSLQYTVVSGYPVAVSIPHSANTSAATGYLYVFVKTKSNDTISGKSTATTSDEIGTFDRFDISSTLLSNYSDSYNTFEFDITNTNVSIYDISDNLVLSRITQDPNNLDKYTYTFTGKFDKNLSKYYVTFIKMEFSMDAHYTDSFTFQSPVNFRFSNCDLDFNSNDLNLIHNDLNEIKKLISDIHVEEINNIYNNITNNYDIDIDSNIDNLINNLQLNLNGLNIDDPKFSLTNSDSEAANKLSVFKQIGTAIINTYDDTGISYLYFVPVILMIIGAVIG